MSEPSFQDKVHAFFNLLDEHVVEMQVEAEGRGVVRLFFDAKDIRYSIFGVTNLFDGHRFTVPVFRTEAAMVQCLGFSGWLGRMHMLQPHQHELLGALNQPRTFNINDWDEFVLSFLREISFRRSIPPIRGMAAGELYNHIKKYVGSTYEAFKAFQFVLGASDWRKRLKKMREEHVLALDLADDPTAQTSTMEFRHLKRILDEKRPKVPLNNFADALALSILMDSVLRFNSGRASYAPAYFDTTYPRGGGGFFRDVAEAAGLSDRFRYWLGERSFSALKPESYFRFRAMFRPPSDKIGAALGREVDGKLLSGDGLRKLRDEIEELTRASRIAEDTLVSFLGTSLGEIMKNIEELSFFRYVWEGHAAEEEAQRILVELNLSQLGEQEFIEGVQGALVETLDTLRRNTDDYRWMSALWSGIKEKEETLRLIGIIDVTKDFRLGRFSFPKGVLPHVQSVLSAVTQRVGEAERENAMRTAIQSCYRAFHPEAIRRDSDEADYREALYLSCALLWLVSMYEELVALLERQVNLDHHSLRILRAAALLKCRYAGRGRTATFSHSRVPTYSLEREIEGLKEEFAKAKDQPTIQGEIAVGLGYLLFEYWLSLGYWPEWRRRKQTQPSGQPDDKSIGLIREAVRFSSYAFELLEERDTAKAMYALNQRLYYLAEGGTEDEIKDMMIIARDLLRLREREPEYWQYTYDDTMARYSHRLALLEDKRDEKLRLMREAMRLAELAARDSGEADPQITIYRDQLRIDLDVLEREGTSPK